MTTHGGHREGAGRPSKFKHSGSRVNVYLPQHQIEYLKMEGFMSAKIQELVEADLHNLALKIYSRVYQNMNDVSDTTHGDTKTNEIYEWLVNGDLRGATVESLAGEWIEYDQEPEP